MKKRFIFQTVLMAFFAITMIPGFQSCKNDKDEPDEPTTSTIDFSKSNAIVGTWQQTDRIADDGDTTSDKDNKIVFYSNGTFTFKYGDGGIFKSEGTYTYQSISKDKGIAKGVSDESQRNFTFTIESYSEYRYKITIVRPNMTGTSEITEIGLYRFDD